MYIDIFNIINRYSRSQFSDLQNKKNCKKWIYHCKFVCVSRVNEHWHTLPTCITITAQGLLIVPTIRPAAIVISAA
jgi:hypothetical protein